MESGRAALLVFLAVLAAFNAAAQRETPPLAEQERKSAPSVWDAKLLLLTRHALHCRLLPLETFSSYICVTTLPRELV